MARIGKGKKTKNLIGKKDHPIQWELENESGMLENNGG